MRKSPRGEGRGGVKAKQSKARQGKVKGGGSKCNRSGLGFSLFTSFFSFHPGVLRVSHRPRGCFCVGLGLGLVICVLKLFGVS